MKSTGRLICCRLEVVLISGAAPLFLCVRVMTRSLGELVNWIESDFSCLVGHFGNNNLAKELFVKYNSCERYWRGTDDVAQRIINFFRGKCGVAANCSIKWLKYAPLGVVEIQRRDLSRLMSANRWQTYRLFPVFYSLLRAKSFSLDSHHSLIATLKSVHFHSHQQLNLNSQ